jgi:hypothetical protein
LNRPHLSNASKCEARQGLMCISKTKSRPGKELGWALIYRKFIRPHEICPNYPFFNPSAHV